LATLLLGDINTGTWPSRLGSNETLKYGLSSAGLRPKSDCSGKAQKQLYRKIDPSSRQRGSYKITNPQLSKRNFNFTGVLHKSFPDCACFPLSLLGNGSVETFTWQRTDARMEELLDALFHMRYVLGQRKGGDEATGGETPALWVPCKQPLPCQ
jgi:hypothetical protein